MEQDLAVERVGNTWLFSDGTTLPVVSGGDGDEEVKTEVESDPYEGLSDYGRQFVESMPEDQRPIGIEWVKNWDSGYQQQMQRVQERYSPYEQLGTPQSLEQEVRIARMLQSNPAEVVEKLVEGGFLDPSKLSFAQRQQLAEQQQEDPKPWESQLSEQQKALGAMAQWIQTQEQQRIQQQQEAALDRTLQQIKSEVPGIDDRIALSFLSAGVDPKDVKKAWGEITQSILKNHRAPNAPRTMPGAGNANVKPADVAKMSDEDRRRYVSQMISGLSS